MARLFPTMTECIFCKILDEEIPARTVYEDEHVLAFLDVNPLTPGHTLVIPKIHTERIHQMDPHQAARYFQPVPRVVEAVETATGTDAATLAWNDGKAAGQEVPHAHLHIVPRTDDDEHGPIHALFHGTHDVDDDEMTRLQDAIQAHLGT